MELILSTIKENVEELRRRSDINQAKIMKCQYGGCKNKAAYQTTQTVGKRQTLLICEDCAPAWVKNLKPITRFYKVEKV